MNNIPIIIKLEQFGKSIYINVNHIVKIEANDDFQTDLLSSISNHKFIIYYDDVYDVLFTYPTDTVNDPPILPVFKTRKIAQKCIKEFEEEIKEVLL